MKAFVYVGGTVSPQDIRERPAPDDLTVAADCGYRNALLCGVRPMLTVGDFDSGRAPEDGEILTLPQEKDETDGQYAVREAIRRGADEIVIVGGMNGRIDHTLSCLAILEECAAMGIPAVVTDGKCRTRCLKDGTFILRRDGYRYFSLIALDGVVSGVFLEGAKYPLSDAEIRRPSQYAVSNEIVGEQASVTVGSGTVYLIESNG